MTLYFESRLDKLLAACIFLGAAAALAQQYSANEVTVGVAAQTWSYRYLDSSGQYAYEHHLEDAKPSFTYTRNLSPSLALEGTVDPGSQFLYTNDLESGHETLALGGVKAGWRGQQWGFYGKAQAGVASWSCGNFYYAPHPYSDCSRVTSFAFEYGGVVERHLAGRYSLRVEAAHLLSTGFDHVLSRYSNGFAFYLRSGETLQHLDLRLGVTRSFGAVHDTHKEPVPPASRWDVGASFYLQPRAEPIDHILLPYPSPGLWSSWNFSRHVSWDTTLIHSGAGRNEGYVYSGAQTGGRSFEALTGLKAGVRRDHMGYFAKLRGGTVTFGETERIVVLHSNGAYTTSRGKLTSPVLDAGGVLEVYPSRHTILRFDAGSATTFYPDKYVWQYVPEGSAEVGQRYKYPSYSETGILLGFGAGIRF